MRNWPVLVGTVLMIAAPPALAEQNTITCTGTLIDVWLKPNADWPLAVIYDAAGGYTCSLDRTGAGHDPMRPCTAGKRCRVVGTYRKFGAGQQPTYAIRSLTDLSDLADEGR